METEDASSQRCPNPYFYSDDVPLDSFVVRCTWVRLDPENLVTLVDQEVIGFSIQLELSPENWDSLSSTNVFSLSRPHEEWNDRIAGLYHFQITYTEKRSLFSRNEFPPETLVCPTLHLLPFAYFPFLFCRRSRSASYLVVRSPYILISCPLPSWRT